MTSNDPTVAIDGLPVPLDDVVWLQQRPCGCTVAAVVAVFERAWTLATAVQAGEHFNPTAMDRARAATARLTVVPVTSAQYAAKYRPRWRCDVHAARSAV